MGEQNDKLENVELDKIEIHPDVPNVRTKISKSECADLMKSIRTPGPAGGVQNPIQCFKLDGRYFLVSGERRLSSCRWIREEDPKDERFRTIPVLIKNLGATKEEIIRNALFLNLTENIQRDDVNGYDLAIRLKDLIDKGMEKPDICANLGKSVSWVNETLKFLDADPDVQKAVKSGKLTMDEGKKIARLNPEIQSKTAEGLAAAKEIGDKGAKRAIKNKMRAAVSRTGVARPSTKEIKYYFNVSAAVLKAMKDAEEEKTIPFATISGYYFCMEWALGQRKDPSDAFNKLLNKYKIEVDERGNAVKNKQIDIEKEAKNKSKTKDSKKK
jgi:ParB/RepB/Spo0J family partition protein